MATFYTGYAHPVLKGRTDSVNTYTGKLGVYSNWDLMNPNHVLDGAPDVNRVPGSGPYGEGDVTMSRWFLGLDVPMRKSTLRNAGILHPDVYSGRWITELFRGVPSSNIWTGGAQGLIPFGHPPLLGRMADYAEFSNYIFYGLPIEQALSTNTLGHAERYPNYATGSRLGADRSNPGQASSFGAFEPYIYKGVIPINAFPNGHERRFSDPLGPQTPGHPEWPSSLEADVMPSDYGKIPPPRPTVERYGFEHVQEWFGVPSAKAL